MFDHLQIYNARERTLVGLADLGLAPVRWLSPSAPAASPKKILILRLERIGDLLMVRDAIARARALWPDADIDLAVGSWNAPLARWMPELTNVDVLDVPWLAREGRGQSWPAMLTHATNWRDRHYDLTINFEPDIRSNVLAWMSAAPRRAGYWTGGGGALLTDALAYDATAHTSANALRLLAHIGPDVLDAPTARPLIPDVDSMAAAAQILVNVPHAHRLAGLHVSGGRESKQWHLSRFADVGRALAAAGDVTLVLTGAASDRAMVDVVKNQLGNVPVVDTAGALDLTVTAAVLARLSVLVTGDTGPMHLAAAVGTPVVALFGPSDPRRYGPLTDRASVLRVQLHCSPCGQVRLPPERCRGRVPECMDGITVESVVTAAERWLREASR